MIFCHHCGKAVPAGTTYCPYCGYPVNNLNNINRNQPRSIQPQYYQRSYKHNKYNKFLKILLIIVIVIILIVGAGLGIYAYNQHEYYATNYTNLNYNGGKYGYTSDVSHSKFWQKPHYVIVKHNLRVYNISTKGTAMVDSYSIGSKILKKGSIVREEWTPTTPGGFGIHGKGFHDSKSSEAAWMVNPGSIDSKKAPTYRKMNSNYWIKAVRKY